MSKHEHEHDLPQSGLFDRDIYHIDPIRKDSTLGMSVDLADRALMLIDSLDNGLQASKMGGLLVANESNFYDVKPRVNPDIIDSAAGSLKKAEVKSRQAFRRAYWGKALKNTNPILIKKLEEEADKEHNKFLKPLIGSGNVRERRKRRKKWEKYK
jgi:hypothetical protein